MNSLEQEVGGSDSEDEESEIVEHSTGNDNDGCISDDD